MSYQENKQSTKDGSWSGAARKRGNLLYAGLIGVDLIIMQDFISTGVSDLSAFISVLAFAVGLPLLAIAVFLFNSPHVKFLSFDWSNFTFILCSFDLTVGYIASLIGVGAAFWHISWIAGIVILASGVVATVTFFAVEFFLQTQQQKKIDF